MTSRNLIRDLTVAGLDLGVVPAVEATDHRLGLLKGTVGRFECQAGVTGHGHHCVQCGLVGVGAPIPGAVQKVWKRLTICGGMRECQRGLWHITSTICTLNDVIVVSLP